MVHSVNVKTYIVLIVLVAINAAIYFMPVRWDMTDDKHYSLSEASKSLLRQTDEPIEVTLLLDGDLNAGFRRLKKATEETLDEMDVFGDVRRNDVRCTKEIIYQRTYQREVEQTSGEGFERQAALRGRTVLRRD